MIVDTGYCLVCSTSPACLAFHHVLAAEDGCVIENCIISHFNEPSVFFPELKIILDSLEDWELQRLFSLLMQNRLLSVYQICLIIIAMPEHSLRVKHKPSSNTLRDVLMMLKTLKGEVSVGKCDLTGGIYSVEDAVYRIMGAEQTPDIRHISWNFNPCFADSRPWRDHRCGIFRNGLVSWRMMDFCIIPLPGCLSVMSRGVCPVKWNDSRKCYDGIYLHGALQI